MKHVLNHQSKSPAKNYGQTGFILFNKGAILKKMDLSTRKSKPFILIFFSILLSFSAYAQNKQPQIPKDTLIKAAIEIIKANPYCALVTIDSNGQPQVRTMNPFPIADEITIWFATSRKSRKVSEIKNNQKVSVYYADHSTAKGYVNIIGIATIIDDKELLLKMKRDYWNGIPDWQNKFVLIKITPKTMDVINYQRGISGDSETSKSPTVSF